MNLGQEKRKNIKEVREGGIREKGNFKERRWYHNQPALTKSFHQLLSTLTLLLLLNPSFSRSAATCPLSLTNLPFVLLSNLSFPSTSAPTSQVLLASSLVHVTIPSPFEATLSSRLNWGKSLRNSWAFSQGCRFCCASSHYTSSCVPGYCPCIIERLARKAFGANIGPCSEVVNGKGKYCSLLSSRNFFSNEMWKIEWILTKSGSSNL